jgi:uncharacterized membrane protein/uncharacterized protein (UPF0548 family)
MADWRFLGGWSDAFVRARLEQTDSLPVSCPLPWDELTLERGWRHVGSRSLVAREPPGSPTPDGALSRAAELVQAFRFSDPRTVVAHFDTRRPLTGRAVLLELRAVGLRYLCPTRVERVRRDGSTGEARFSLGLVTLEGHLECGREWFHLTQDLTTGELIFDIQARWRPGQFPNRWSRFGFGLLSRRYQRAWHRLAQRRMRRLLHEGVHLDDAPIQWMSRRGAEPNQTEVEQEAAPMGHDSRWTGLGLSALSGFRSFTPLAALAMTGRREGSPLLLPILARTVRPAGLDALALGEIAADKTAWIPTRTSPPALFGRALAGSAVGASFGMRRDRRWLGPALIGAAAAIAGSFVSYQLREQVRRSTRLPSAALGLVEDALVIAASTALVSRLRT